VTQILSVGARIDWLWNNGVGQQRWAIRGSRLSTPEAFGGCHPIELPSNKAAPLHGLGSATLSRRNPVKYDDEDEDDYEERLALYFSFEIPDHAPDVSNPGTRLENLQTLLIRTHLQEFNSDSASAPANHFPTRRHIEIDSVCAH
jgi:hypothetical protein